MVKIVIGEDCGNSPRKEFIKELQVAFAKGNYAFISDHLSEGISWNIVGETILAGKKEFIAALVAMNAKSIKELKIDRIITHGRDASSNGYVLLRDGTKYAFCDVYEFTGAARNTIKGVTSYVIQIRSLQKTSQ